MIKAPLKFVSAVLIWTATAIVAQAQQNAAPNMSADEVVPSLMFFTLGAVLLIAVGAFVYFLRKRSNRDATARALGVDEASR